MENFAASAYTLKCVVTDHEFEDAGWTLEDRECSEPSLIRTVYNKKKLELKGPDYGLYTFCD